MTDFPTTPAVEPMKSFDWDSAALRTAIGKVLHAAAEPNDTDPRPLASICFDFSDALDIVATDAKQVAAYTLPIPGDGRFLVPRESASTLLKLLDATDGKIAVVLGEKSASFSGSDWTYLSVLMAGGFPPWKSVVTEGMPAISMVRSDLIRAVRSALPFGMEAGFTRVELVGKDKTLTVHSGLANAMDTTITAEFDGEIKMAVEGRRLMSLVSALEGENVVIKFDDVPGHGIIMREENFMGIIMPLRK
jgi:DNA polymerase III sliding clamp (beta) subunit (PCNA family)